MGSTPRVDGTAAAACTPIEGLPPNLIDPHHPLPLPAALPGLGRRLPPASARARALRRRPLGRPVSPTSRMSRLLEVEDLRRPLSAGPAPPAR